MLRRPPSLPLFPYTTLFRSDTLYHVEQVLLESPRGQRSQRRVAAVRATGKGLLLRLDGVDDCDGAEALRGHRLLVEDRKSTRLNSSHVRISYAVFCLKKKTR